MLGVVGETGRQAPSQIGRRHSLLSHHLGLRAARRPLSCPVPLGKLSPEDKSKMNPKDNPNIYATPAWAKEQRHQAHIAKIDAAYNKPAPIITPTRSGNLYPTSTYQNHSTADSPGREPRQKSAGGGRLS